MCALKVQDRVPSKGLRERLGLDDKILVLQQNNDMGMCYEKKTMIGRRNVWSMKWREGVSGQKADQRKLGQRLWKKTVRY